MPHATPLEKSAHRRAAIKGLRQLADALVENPGLPVPRVIDITYYPRRKTDAANRREIDRVAEILGVRPRTDRDGEHYRAVRRFSCVTYRAVTVTAKAKARWKAMVRHRDNPHPNTNTDKHPANTDRKEPPSEPPTIPALPW